MRFAGPGGRNLCYMGKDPVLHEERVQDANEGICANGYICATPTLKMGFLGSIMDMFSRPPHPG